MTVTQLKYVITIAGSKSMNEAAGKRFISQPSLSTTIKELEEETGVEIFIRNNKGITLRAEDMIALCLMSSISSRIIFWIAKLLNKLRGEKTFLPFYVFFSRLSHSSEKNHYFCTHEGTITVFCHHDR